MAATVRVNQVVGAVQDGFCRLGFELYAFLRFLGRNPVVAVESPTVGASPWTYTNTGDYDQDLVIAGGTVSAVSFSRGGVLYPVGTNGLIRLNPGDSVQVVYSVLPVARIISR